MLTRTFSRLLCMCFILSLAVLVRPTSSVHALNTTIPRFIDEASAIGINQQVDLYGPNVADYHNDGRLDLLFTNHFHHPSLFQQQSVGNVIDVAAQVGIRTDEDKHGAAFGDCDNDGHLDLYISIGANKGTGSKPKQLYRNVGNGTFQNIAQSAGVADPLTRGRAASWVDFDNDGKLDLYVNNRERPGTRDRLGIGARVVVTTADGLRQTRLNNGGMHRWSQDELILSYGLGSRTQVAQITVFWPSGVTQQLNTIAANQRITITEPQ